MDSKIMQYWLGMQRTLFPELEGELGPQTPKHGQIMVVLDWIDVHDYFYEPMSYSFIGRPRMSRAMFACAFIAKSVLNLPTTEALLDRLRSDKVLRRICGFATNRRLPCKASFSNAFAEFAATDLPSKIHESLIKVTYQEKLDNKIVGHVSRDATDISAPGRTKKVAREDKGRRKNRIRGKNRRVVRQIDMTQDEMLADLPKGLDAGCKRGHHWKGYKLHLDVGDGDVPISAILTSASLHDSQAAIPLSEMTSNRVDSLYTLMDSAYDASEIRQFEIKKGKVAIIEPHNRQGQTITLDPAERERYGQRVSAERVNSRLKEHFGARTVRVQGHAKVMAHLMFGVLALTVEQIIRHFT